MRWRSTPTGSGSARVRSIRDQPPAPRRTREAAAGRPALARTAPGTGVATGVAADPTDGLLGSAGGVLPTGLVPRAARQVRGRGALDRDPCSFRRSVPCGRLAERTGGGPPHLPRDERSGRVPPYLPRDPHDSSRLLRLSRDSHQRAWCLRLPR
ncbi:hypothetical protein GCM10023317_69090 [Actinopolymorpha pittospori]